MSVVAIALLSVVVPIGLGAVAGAALARRRGSRCSGWRWACAFLVAPAALMLGLGVSWPVVGLWDAALEGVLVGVGLLVAAHHAFRDRRDVVRAAASSAATLLLLEVLCRLVLPPPPGFPNGRPHFLLANALSGDARHQPWDTLSKDIVCSVVYGESYPPIYGTGAARPDVVTPSNFVPRADARQRVLHLGDSMAFGFGLERSEVFTARLERLGPHVEHVNGSIPGTAPDAYFAVLGAWLARYEVDLVVMHVFAGNDLQGLDGRHPCCAWQPLLAYDAKGASLRCPAATPPDFRSAGFAWLRYHSPPPYLVRALVHVSSAAGHLGHAMVLEPYFLAEQSEETSLAHLVKAVDSARVLLAAKAIPLIVVVLPERPEALWRARGDGPRIVAALREGGAQVLDPADVVQEVERAGAPMFLPNGDIHYTAEGHDALARWLHARLFAPAPMPRRD